MAFFRRTKKRTDSNATTPVAAALRPTSSAVPQVSKDTAAIAGGTPTPSTGTVTPKSPILDTLLQPVSDDQQPLPFDRDTYKGADEITVIGKGRQASQKRKVTSINGLDDLKALGLPRAVIRQKGLGEDKEYDYAPLYTGEKVIELWRPEGDTLIYLCSKGERRQPSFFVSSHVLSSKSDFFIRAISPIWQADNEIDTESFPGAKYSLYFGPDKSDDRTEETDAFKLLRHYIIIRNVFACMFDSTCVELEGDETLLTDIADRMLMYFEGSDVGVAQELGSFITRSGLWDVRNDPVKALDLLIFASRYKIENLYKEAFAHVVGMLPRVKQLEAFEVIEDGRLLSLLEDAHSVMQARLNMAIGALHEFHFKKMWASNAPVYTIKPWVTWRSAYEEFRKFLYQYYTKIDGRRWISKELNRSVAMDLHDDFCSLFDLLVNRSLQTSDAVNYYAYWKDYCRVLAAHDKSLNEQPPLPYGMPKLPGPAITSGTPETGPMYNKEKLGSDRVAIELPQSYNLHKSNRMDIVKEFKAWERKVSSGKKMKDIAERRRGYWLLIYGVLSALAEVIVEDNIHFSEDVEYFLCCETRNIVYWEGDEDGEEDIGVATSSSPAPANSWANSWGAWGNFANTKNKKANKAKVATTSSPHTTDNTPARRCLESYCWRASAENWYQ